MQLLSRLTLSTALATACIATPLLAQQASLGSYDAAQPSVTGSVSVSTVGNTDTFTVSSPTAILDFIPNGTPNADGVIDFQPGGTAIYQGASNFTVLNRIVPGSDAPIAFNGTVRSQIGIGANGTPGGSLWFYSPGGIVLADGAAFDIGNLLLTTIDPAAGTNTFSTAFIDTSAAGYNPNGIVNILSGASITASAANSYIAVVAPQVLQRGTIDVNGSAAFVAAEQATLTFNQGLFDINVIVGTDADAFPLQLRGSITGPSSAAGSPNHGIYAVAVPKNDAITMVVAPDGNFGFTPATGISVATDGIYLQATGLRTDSELTVNVNNAAGTRIVTSPTAGTDANISIEGGTFRSLVAAQASNAISVTTGTRTIAFQRDAYLFGRQSALVRADTGGAVSTGVTNSGVLSPANLTIASFNADAGAGGLASLAVLGGAVTVNGALAVNADGRSSGTISAVGGTASVVVGRQAAPNVPGVNGSLTVSNSTIISAGAFVTQSTSTPGAGGSATGGTATLSLANGASGTATSASLPNLNVVAAGTVTGVSAGAGGNARSGTASVQVGAGTTLTSSLNIAANALGGGSASAQSGSANMTGAGAASLLVSGTANLTVLNVLATGQGANSAVGGGNGGSARGGAAIVTASTGGTINLTNGISMNVSATGGEGAATGVGAAGGTATGGTITLSSQGTISSTAASQSTLFAGAFAGNGYGSAVGGAATGGNINVSAAAGSIAFASGSTLVLTSEGSGGGSIAFASGGNAFGGGAGGAGTAGQVAITALTTASSETAIGRITLGSTQIELTGRGGVGAGFAGTGTGGAGGAGTGGTTTIFAEAGNGRLTTGTVIVNANGIGNTGGGGIGAGTGGVGGIGVGGLTTIGVRSGTASSFATGSATFSNVTVNGNGTGGTGGDSAGTPGVGGDGVGGRHAVVTAGGAVTATNISLVSRGTAGNGGAVTGTQDRAATGIARGGEVGLIGVARTNQPSQRGSISITNTLSGFVQANSIDGVGGDVFINLVNADATINAVNYSMTATLPSPTDALSDLVVSGGTLRVNTLNVSTTSDIGVYAFNGGRFDLRNAALSASGSLLFGEGTETNNNFANGTNNLVPAGTPPTNFDDIDVSGDLFLFAGNDLTFTQDIGVGGRLGLQSGSRLTFTNVSAGEGISLGGETGVFGGTVRAGLDPNAEDLSVDIFADSGSINIGSVTGLGIFIEQGRGDDDTAVFGPVTTGLLTGESVIVSTRGDTTIAGVAGSDLFAGVDINNSLISLSSSQGNLQVGDIVGRGTVGLNAINVSAGNITTAGSVLVLADQNVSLGAVSTGTTGSLFISNRTIGYDVTDSELDEETDAVDAFNPMILRTATPLRVGGSIAINGVVNTGYLQAAATGSITSGTLNAATLLSLNSGTTIVLGDVTTAADLSLSADGGVTTGAVRANRVALQSSGGGITTAAVTSARSITLSGATGITAGNLTAVNTISANSGNGALALGNVETTGGAVALGSGAALTVGNVRAAGSIMVMANGAVTGGDMTAGTGPMITDTGSGGLGSGTQSNTPAGIAPGFNSFSLPRCDDCFSEAAALGFTANFFGTSYTNTFVSNNGYVTFGRGQSNFSPEGLGASYRGLPIIAAFFVDIDTRPAGTSVTTYGTGMYAGRAAFGATYDGVGRFSNLSDKLNNFQIILADRSDTGIGNFDIYYNYTNIDFESSGGTGIGGNAASVGFNAGTGGQMGTFFELPGSRVAGSFLDTGTMPLAQYSANGVLGQVLFNVRNGMVVQPDSGPASITITNTGAPAGSRDINVGRLSGESVTINGAGSVRTGDITITPLDATMPTMSDGLIDISAAAGDLVVGGLTNASTVTIDAAGNLQAGAIGASGPVTIAATTGGINVGAVQSTTGAIAMNASGAVALNGAVTGSTVALRSNDIVICANGGVTASQGITLTSLSTTGPALLGGTGGANYVLDSAEISRLRAPNIAFVQQGFPSGDAQIILRDLTLVGSGGTNPNLVGANGTFSVSTAGSIRVTGNVRVTDAASTNGLRFVAGDSFDLVTDTGSVGVFGAANALGGSLSIQATDITVADQALFNTSSQTNFDNVTNQQVIDAINRPAAVTRPEGFLQAGALSLAAGDFIAIQNSGTTAVPGGFSANSMTIVSLSGRSDQTVANALNVVANGRVANATGTFLTGADTLGGITFVTGESNGNLTGFSTPSVINGCTIVGRVCTSAMPVVMQMPTNAANVRDLVDGPLSSTSSSDEAFNVPTIRVEAVIDLASLRSDSLITDPVASSGNVSLWQSVTTVSQSGVASGLGPSKRNQDAKKKPAPRTEKRR